MSKNKPLVVKLPEDLKKELKILAAKQGVGMTAIVHQLVSKYIADSKRK